jgi:hypothetical protein
MGYDHTLTGNFHTKNFTNYELHVINNMIKDKMGYTPSELKYKRNRRKWVFIKIYFNKNKLKIVWRPIHRGMGCDHVYDEIREYLKMFNSVRKVDYRGGFFYASESGESGIGKIINNEFAFEYNMCSDSDSASDGEDQDEHTCMGEYGDDGNCLCKDK